MKGCAVHWVTTELKGAGIGQSLQQLGCGPHDEETGVQILAGEIIFFGVHIIKAASEVLPGSCSCGTWGAVAVARRQPPLSV